MCQYQTLYYDDKTGYVIRCMHCENFQVGFGNVLINLHLHDFHDLCDWIKTYRAEHVSTESSTIKSIIIPTPCDGLKLFLSPRELQELHDMLDTADSEYRSQEMLKLFAEKRA